MLNTENMSPSEKEFFAKAEKFMGDDEQTFLSKLKGLAADEIDAAYKKVVASKLAAAEKGYAKAVEVCKMFDGEELITSLGTIAYVMTTMLVDIKEQQSRYQAEEALDGIYRMAKEALFSDHG